MLPFNAIVVGTGFAGATAANLLATKYCMNVLVVEQRNHIGGQMYDFRNEEGLLIQKYGPHIFHTDSEAVYDYIKPFTKLNDYVHRVKADIDGQFVELPFNLDTAKKLLNYKLYNKFDSMLDSFISESFTYSKLSSDENATLQQITSIIYDKILSKYSKKQWGSYFKSLDTNVFDRVPIRCNHDSRYFTDKYQGMPVAGYTEMIKLMLDHSNISVMTNCNFNAIVDIDDKEQLFIYGHSFDGPIFYSGQLDHLMRIDERLFEGAGTYNLIPYRSLDFDFETTECRLPAAVVNYPNTREETRDTDFSYFYKNNAKNTVICHEVPKQGDGKNDFYYPIPSDSARAQYIKCLDVIKSKDVLKNIHPIGRAGLYKYMNMDATILSTMSIVDSIMLEK